MKNTEYCNKVRKDREDASQRHDALLRKNEELREGREMKKAILTIHDGLEVDEYKGITDGKIFIGECDDELFKRDVSKVEHATMNGVTRIHAGFGTVMFQESQPVTHDDVCKFYEAYR